MIPPVIAYHYHAGKLRNERPLPQIGEWLEHNGPLVMCESGLHASECPFDALAYAPGAMLDRVEIDGETLRYGNKLCARRRRRIATIDATELLRTFARWCALRVIDRWGAPEVVRRYLETGDETLRDAVLAAALDAAWDAAPTAAWPTAWAATPSVVLTAARATISTDELAAWRAKFREMVDAAFARGGPQ